MKRSLSTGLMLWALTAVVVMAMPGCAKVGGVFADFGRWVQTLDRTHTEEVTREKRRVQR